MSFFPPVTPQTTEEDLKALYRELVKIHHPDKGGNADDFNKVQEEYDMNILKIRMRNADPKKLSDSAIWKGIRAGSNEMLKQQGLKELDELLPDTICSYIDRVKVPENFEHIKELVKMLIRSQFDLDKIADAAANVVRKIFKGL